MLSIGKLVAGQERYYQRQIANGLDDYYAGRGEAPGRWIGAGAASLGLEVYDVHVDNGTSGAIRNRPEFLAWLADARKEHVGTLIASHSDRLTREGVNAAAMVLDVVEGGGAFRLVP